MRKIKINRIDLELAFELSSYETSAYLDAETGAVLFAEEQAASQLDDILTDEESMEAAQGAIQARTDLSDEERAQIMDVARIEWDTEGRYLLIPKQDSSEGYREMEDFIETVEDHHLRELLEVAIQGRGAFRRFKDVLYRYPDAEANWFRFRDAREQRRLLEWLASKDIEPDFV